MKPTFRPALPAPALGMIRNRPLLGLDFSDVLGVDLSGMAGAAAIGACGVGAVLISKLVPDPFDTVSTIAGVGLIGLSLWRLAEAASGESLAKKAAADGVDFKVSPPVEYKDVATTENAKPTIGAVITSPKEGETVYQLWGLSPKMEVKFTLVNNGTERKSVQVRFTVIEGPTAEDWHEETKIFDAPVGAWTKSFDVNIMKAPLLGHAVTVELRVETLGGEPTYSSPNSRVTVWVG